MDQEKIVDPTIKKALDDACREVADFLPNITPEQTNRIIKQYVAAIEGNFVAWMGTAAICTQSVQGRYAASENLWVEMKDNHAGMLRAFAQAAHCEPGLEDYQAVANAVADIRQLVARLSGLECLALMATLETTSAIFIPWLEKAATSLGSTDLRYTTIHGEADIQHAEQFAWVLTYEMKQYQNTEAIQDTINVTVEFLKKIFAPA